MSSCDAPPQPVVAARTGSPARRRAGAGWLALAFSLQASALDPGLPVRAQATKVAQPRYAAALAQELKALGFAPDCRALSDVRYACTYPARSRVDAIDLTAHAQYDDDTDSVYVYIPLFTIHSDAPELHALLRRAMEINWQLLSAKLEWDAASGELRMSAMMHTDSNFDRRAFRSLVRALDRSCVRFYTELAHMVARAASATPKRP